MTLPFRFHTNNFASVSHSYVSNVLSISFTEGKRPQGRPTLRWEDDIKMDLKEIVWEGVD